MANWKFEKPICPCGSDDVYQGCQHHDDNDEWHTKQWWDEHPDQKPPGTQMLLYVSDPTNWTCNKCGYQFSLDEIENIIEPLRKEWVRKWSEAGMPIKEEIGMAVINPRGIRNLMKNTKVG